MLTTERPQGLWHRLHHSVFHGLYDRNLLYNTCWEDPAVDRQALNIDADSEILVITSAGCNALDYALEGPCAVHAVDANPRQNALLELKQAGIRALSWDDFFLLFGHGRHPGWFDLYPKLLRPQLCLQSQQIWDRCGWWFTHAKGTRSFYYHGLSGIVARAVSSTLRMRRKLWGWMEAMLHASSLERQCEIFDAHVGPRLISKPLAWALNRQVTMSLLGVPYAQREMVQQDHADGVAGFVRDCLAWVCRELPLRDNYFWTLYLRGRYSEDNCPRYLTHEGFAALKSGLVDRVHSHSTTVMAFLRDEHHGADINRFVLLDHLDWMSHHFPQALVEEWEALFARARPGSRVLFRSGSRQPGFLTQALVRKRGLQAPLMEHLELHPELSAALDRQDRVHTYASFHIADI